MLLWGKTPKPSQKCESDLHLRETVSINLTLTEGLFGVFIPLFQPKVQVHLRLNGSFFKQFFFTGLLLNNAFNFTNKVIIITGAL